MSNKINVILVDDHEMVRLGLKSFLNLQGDVEAVSYTHLRAHETRHDLVCRLLLEKKK